MLNEVI